MFGSTWLSQNQGYLRQVLVSSSVSILSFLYGFLETWPSLSIARLQEGAAGFPVSEAEISTIVTMNTLSEALTPVVLGFVLINFGRKTNLLFNAAVYIIGWALITFAASPIYFSIANFIAGFGCATLHITGSIFLAEIADKRNRGALISIYVLAITLGQIFYTGVGIYLSYDTLNNIALVLSITAFFCLLAFVTESPYWFLIKQDDAKAEASYRYYRNPRKGEAETKVAEELAELKTVVAAEMTSKSSYRELFATKSNIEGSIIVIGLSIFQGAGGVITILTFASTTLPKYDGFFQPNPTLAAVSFLNCVTNLIVIGLVDTWGRRPLTILSNAGNGIGTGIIAVYFFLEEFTAYDTSDIKWVPYVGVLVFFTFFGLAMAAVPHLLAGELFPANVRYQANAISVVCFASVTAFYNYVYLDICHTFGVSVMYGIFTLFSVTATVFSCVYVFETKGLTLAEIQARAVGKQRSHA